MRRVFIIAWGIGFLFTLAAVPVWSAESEVRLVRSDATGAVIEMTLSGYKVSQKAIGNTIYEQVAVSDLGQSKDIGKPEVPLQGTLIGIPEKGKVTLKATGLDYHSFRLDRELAPATSPSGQSADPVLDDRVYKTNAFYPGPLATEGFTGYMRDQKVMQILFYPVQYNPVTHEVRVYKGIRAEVTFDQPINTLSKMLPRAKPHPRAYEKLLQDSLLNYKPLQR